MSHTRGRSLRSRSPSEVGCSTPIFEHHLGRELPLPFEPNRFRQHKRSGRRSAELRAPTTVGALRYPHQAEWKSTSSWFFGRFFDDVLSWAFFLLLRKFLPLRIRAARGHLVSRKFSAISAQWRPDENLCGMFRRWLGAGRQLKPPAAAPAYPFDRKLAL
jgi:hypothetical protein